jgi:hypothetical protein
LKQIPPGLVPVDLLPLRGASVRLCPGEIIPGPEIDAADAPISADPDAVCGQWLLDYTIPGAALMHTKESIMHAECTLPARYSPLTLAGKVLP